MKKIVILVLLGSATLIQPMEMPLNAKKRKGNFSEAPRELPQRPQAALLQNPQPVKRPLPKKQNQLLKKTKIKKAVSKKSPRIKKENQPPQYPRTRITQEPKDSKIIDSIRDNPRCYLVDAFPYVTVEYYYIDQYDKCQQIIVTKDILSEQEPATPDEPWKGAVWQVDGPRQNTSITKPSIFKNQSHLYHGSKPKANSTQEDIEQIKNIINTYQEQNLQEKMRLMENQRRLQQEPQDRLKN